MAQVYETHISEVGTYKRCRRLWNWSGRDRMNLEPRKAYSPFFIGRAWHQGIEDLTSEGIPPLTSLAKFLRKELKVRRESPLWEIDRETVREDVKLTRAMLDQYLAWSRTYKGVYADTSLDYIAHEMSFGEPHTEAIPLMIDGEMLLPEVRVAGKFDGLVRWNPPNGDSSRVLLKEYKTCRSVAERVKLLPKDEQATLYCYAAQYLFGETVEGVLYTLARKKAAAKPKVLQNGNLSQAKNIDTTYENYLAAILKHHGEDVSQRFIEAQYGDMLEYLRDFSEPFVARVLISRSQAQINAYIRELHATVLEMRNPNTYLTANRTWNCPTCFFADPCLARDLCETDRETMLLETMYQQRAHEESTDEEF